MRIDVELLEEGTRALGVLITRKQALQLKEYIKILGRWNKKMNLTAITDERDIVVKHLLDSITCAATGHIIDGLNVIDVGTGAGFPGIPVKILYPDLRITLLDAQKKRVVFLNHVISELGMNEVCAVHGRAEDLARDSVHREGYGLCIVRAVAHLSIVSEYCLPFVNKGGLFFAMKGPGYAAELKAAGDAINVLGGGLLEVQRFRLPFTDINRHIVIIKKLRPTGSEYPRKAGRPAKKPLS